MTTPLAAYTPSPTAVQDVYDLIVSWVGPDADKGTAAVAMSVHKDLHQMRRLLRMAVLAKFPYEDERHEPVAGKDFLPPLDEPSSMLDDPIFFPDRTMAESIKRQMDGAA